MLLPDIVPIQRSVQGGSREVQPLDPGRVLLLRGGGSMVNAYLGTAAQSHAGGVPLRGRWRR